MNRRRIIERPRLTRLLDDSSARIKMLVAPAGYGKTTLARQWLAAREGSSQWITCTSAFSDVAVLLTSLATACSQAVDRPSTRTIERLHAAADPIRELGLLLDLLIDDFRSWPFATSMVLDDYHELMASPQSEEIVQAIISRTELHVVITSRRRPTWATARSLFYGELVQITQSQLAMTSGEVRRTLGPVRRGASNGLIIAAKGWPAFIALAAGLNGARVREADTQATMYEYLAAEIYLAAHSEVRSALRELALAPREHGWLLEKLYGRDVAQRIELDAVRLGCWPRSNGVSEVHPLLQDFLHRQCPRLAPTWSTRPFGGSGRYS